MNHSWGESENQVITTKFDANLMVDHYFSLSKIPKFQTKSHIILYHFVGHTIFYPIISALHIPALNPYCMTIYHVCYVYVCIYIYTVYTLRQSNMAMDTPFMNDFLNETSIYRGISVAKFDFQRVSTSKLPFLGYTLDTPNHWISHYG